MFVDDSGRHVRVLGGPAGRHEAGWAGTDDEEVGLGGGGVGCHCRVSCHAIEVGGKKYNM